jgi:hypothetical protein
VQLLEANLNDQSPRLYREFASWWPLLSRPSDYAQEAAFFTTLFFEATDSPPQTLLELGSGGGNNASHLKAHFKLTLVDQSPQMLAVSRQLNPECEHIAGDMRTVRLGRLFEAVFIHDAIDYMTTEEDLRNAMETAYVHCQAGGVALFVPDHIRENFVTTTQQGGHDGVGRALRYLEWSYDPDKTDTTYVVDFAYLLREGEDEVKVAYDRHIVGLFERAVWLRLLGEVGFEARVVVDDYERELFVAVKIVE